MRHAPKASALLMILLMISSVVVLRGISVRAYASRDVSIANLYAGLDVKVAKNYSVRLEKRSDVASLEVGEIRIVFRKGQKYQSSLNGVWYLGGPVGSDQAGIYLFDRNLNKWIPWVYAVFEPRFTIVTGGKPHTFNINNWTECYVYRDDASKKEIGFRGVTEIRDPEVTAAVGSGLLVYAEARYSVNSTSPYPFVEYTFYTNKDLTGYVVSFSEFAYHIETKTKSTIGMWAQNRMLKDISYSWDATPTSTEYLRPTRDNHSTWFDAYVDGHPTGFPGVGMEADGMVFSLIVPPEATVANPIMPRVALNTTQENWHNGKANGFGFIIAYNDPWHYHASWMPEGAGSYNLRPYQRGKIAYNIGYTKLDEITLKAFWRALLEQYWTLYSSRPEILAPAVDIHELRDFILKSTAFFVSGLTSLDMVKSSRMTIPVLEYGLLDDYRDSSFIVDALEGIRRIVDIYQDKNGRYVHGPFSDWMVFTAEAFDAVVKGYRVSRDPVFLESMERFADWLLTHQAPEGGWHASYDTNGKPMTYEASTSPALPSSLAYKDLWPPAGLEKIAYQTTMSALIIYDLFSLYEFTGNEAYRQAALRGIKWLEGEFNAHSVWLLGEGTTSWNVNDFARKYPMVAFVKAYEITRDPKYLEQVDKWAYYYLLTSYLYEANWTVVGPDHKAYRLPTATLGLQCDGTEAVTSEQLDIPYVARVLPYVRDEWIKRTLMYWIYGMARHFTYAHSVRGIEQAIEGWSPELGYINTATYGPESASFALNTTFTICDSVSTNNPNTLAINANALDLIDSESHRTVFAYNPQNIRERFVVYVNMIHSSSITRYEVSVDGKRVGSLSVKDLRKKGVEVELGPDEYSKIDVVATQ